MIKSIFSVRSDFRKYRKILSELNGDKYGYAMSTATHKHYTPSMPARTKAYSTLINFKPWEYTHLVDYANEVYFTNKNYRKEINPFAMSEYIVGYEKIAMPKILQEAENYIKGEIL